MQLDPVQIAALEFARDKPGVGFFAEQGLGKSLMVLTEFSWYYDQGKVDRMIIVTPNSFKAGFLDEINKHGFRFDVHIWRSAKKDAAVDWMNKRQYVQPPVLILNYEAARMPNVTRALEIWVKRGKAYLAFDESIQLKGHRTAQTRAAHKLAFWSPYTREPESVRYVRILTGRPQTQGPHDLWGQLRCIGLFLHTNFYAFRGTYCVMGGWENKEVLRAKNVEQLAAFMAPVVFQAKKKDWLPNLPRKDMTIRDYRMSEAQQRQYNQMEKQFLLQIANGEIVSVEVAIAKYAKLAQIQVGFIYDEERIVHELVPPAENPRLNLLLQILEEEVEGKVCVVYRHRGALGLLIRALIKWDPAWIKGGMKPEEIQEQKNRFTEDSKCRAILLQCDASKFGHTLLGGIDPDDRCSTMIFFESTYSMDTRSQIEDRIHRRGQTSEYCLYIDLCGSDLDRRITKALQRKDNLYRSVFKNLREAIPHELHSTVG